MLRSCFAEYVEHNVPLKADAENEERLFLLSIRITLVIPSDFKAVGARGAQALRAKAPSSYCIIPLLAEYLTPLIHTLANGCSRQLPSDGQVRNPPATRTAIIIGITLRGLLELSGRCPGEGQGRGESTPLTNEPWSGAAWDTQ